MAIPTYGAPPLAKFFLILRAFQLVAFIVIIGLTANFVAEIVSNGSDVASEIVGTLTVTSLAALYCLITIPFFLADATKSLLAACLIDFLILIAFVVVSVTLGRPVSYLNCFAIGNSSASENAASAFDFTSSVAGNINKPGNFATWSGATRANCFESKAIWGLSVASCILFACSVMVLPALFAKKKRGLVVAAKGGQV